MREGSFPSEHKQRTVVWVGMLLGGILSCDIDGSGKTTDTTR